MVPAAADEVSAGIAQVFSQHAANYQAQAGRAAAFQEQFVQHLTASAGSFAHTEAANTALLQPLTASAASIGSAIGALPGQLFNLANAAVGQLLNDFTAFFLSVLQPFRFIFIVAEVGIFLAIVLLHSYFPNLFANLFPITLPPGFIPPGL